MWWGGWWEGGRLLERNKHTRNKRRTLLSRRSYVFLSPLFHSTLGATASCLPKQSTRVVIEDRSQRVATMRERLSARGQGGIALAGGLSLGLQQWWRGGAGRDHHQAPTYGPPASPTKPPTVPADRGLCVSHCISNHQIVEIFTFFILQRFGEQITKRKIQKILTRNKKT